MPHGNTPLVIAQPAVAEVFYLYNWLVSADQNEPNNTASDFIDSHRQVYYDVMDSYGYYTEVAKKIIDSLGISIHQLMDSADYLVFIPRDTVNHMIELDQLKARSGIIIFNGKDKPVYWESTDRNGRIEHFLRTYFQTNNLKQNSPEKN